MSHPAAICTCAPYPGRLLRYLHRRWLNKFIMKIRCCTMSIMSESVSKDQIFMSKLHLCQFQLLITPIYIHCWAQVRDFVLDLLTTPHLHAEYQHGSLPFLKELTSYWIGVMHVAAYTSCLRSSMLCSRAADRHHDHRRWSRFMVLTASWDLLVSVRSSDLLTLYTIHTTSRNARLSCLQLNLTWSSYSCISRQACRSTFRTESLRFGLGTASVWLDNENSRAIHFVKLRQTRLIKLRMCTWLVHGSRLNGSVQIVL